MTHVGRAGPEGVTFPRTPKGKLYLSRNDHRSFSTDPRRNKWAEDCPPSDEYDVFFNADENDWYDTHPHLWGLKQDLIVLGSSGERIALFRAPSNPPDEPWHGYPVSATDKRREKEHKPEQDLVDRWLAAGMIDEFDAARIKRGRV